MDTFSKPLQHFYSFPAFLGQTEKKGDKQRSYSHISKCLNAALERKQNAKYMELLKKIQLFYYMGQRRKKTSEHFTRSVDGIL